MRVFIHPGYVVSSYDGQEHFVSINELIQLYGLQGRKDLFPVLDEYEHRILVKPKPGGREFIP